ncbi:MAG TPA: flagellar basal body P-ring formation chaperone FlgA [Gemmatimonadaceae bacterium]|nr:flagellar basal body P-ring formation chaperone FlgA [Gemmatimonadaceae bacterium]
MPAFRRLLTMIALAGVARMAGAAGLGAQQPAPAPTVRLAVAARPIARGSVLTDDDITYVERPASAQPVEGGAATVQPGWVARRLINTGEVLRNPAVEPPIVVSANETVDVVYVDGDVQISIRAMVTRDASIGERVTVRTTDGRHLDGVVTGPGCVRIDSRGFHL